jgi:hypothetical protein
LLRSWYDHACDNQEYHDENVLVGSFYATHEKKLSKSLFCQRYQSKNNYLKKELVSSIFTYRIDGRKVFSRKILFNFVSVHYFSKHQTNLKKKTVNLKKSVERKQIQNIFNF